MPPMSIFVLLCNTISSVVVLRLFPVAGLAPTSAVGVPSVDRGNGLPTYSGVDRRAIIGSAGPRAQQCEPIVVPMCSALRYNSTRMPNLLGHVTQRDAAEHINVFIPLVQTGCSRLLKFFLCSMYAPMCTEQVEEVLVIAPCRSLCLAVRTGCEPVLGRFNLEWPDELDCSSLPDSFADRQNLCIDIPSSAPGSAIETAYERQPTGQSSADEYSTDGRAEKAGESAMSEGDVDGRLPGSVAQNGEWRHFLGSLQRLQSPSITQTIPSNEASIAAGIRRDRKKPAAELHDRRSTPSPTCNTLGPSYHNNGSLICMAAVTPTCGSEVLYRSADKRLSEVWMTVWAAVCFASATTTIITFLLDTSRVRTPERPIVYISLCYGVYSASLLFRAGLGAAAVTCHRSSSAMEQQQSRSVENFDVDNFRLIDGLDGAWCTATFVVEYYFSTAAGFWWVVLGLSWYLVASRRWCVDAVNRRLGGYMHAAAWSFPAILTIVSIVQRRVGIDELTSTCGITDIDFDAMVHQRRHQLTSLMDGNEPEVGIPPSSPPPSTVAVLTFVLVPLVFNLTLGLGLLTTGLLSTRRIGRELECRFEHSDVNGRLKQTAGDVTIRTPSTMNDGANGPLDSIVIVVVAGLERLVVRVAVFGLLYVVPQIAFTAFVVYELFAGPYWIAAAEERLQESMIWCASNRVALKATPADAGSNPCLRLTPLDVSIPSVEVMLLKIFAQTAVGLASAAWTWSPSTGRLWIEKISAIKRRICATSHRTYGAGKQCRHGDEARQTGDMVARRRGVSWYVDCNDAGSTNTMRIQRQPKQQPKESLICVATWGIQRQLVDSCESQDRTTRV